jgi:transcriptional regulator
MLMAEEGTRIEQGCASFSPTISLPSSSKGDMTARSLSLVQGTLDLLVLRTLAAGAMHGYAVAARVQEQTGGTLVIEDAALYQALHRLDRQGFVDAEWGPSENNRRARYYALTAAGRRRLREETANWRRYTQAVESVLRGT